MFILGGGLARWISQPLDFRTLGRGGPLVRPGGSLFSLSRMKATESWPRAASSVGGGQGVWSKPDHGIQAGLRGFNRSQGYKLKNAKSMGSSRELGEGAGGRAAWRRAPKKDGKMEWD